MSGWLLHAPRPETLYFIWQAGWALGGACLLWRSRKTLAAETDGRVGWSGNPTAIAVFFTLYLAAAFLVLPGVAFSMSETLAKTAPELPKLGQALQNFLWPLLCSFFLLGLRRFVPEFSPARPHRVRPAGEFGFTPAGLLRSFAGAMALVVTASLLWYPVLVLMKTTGIGDFLKSQDIVKFLVVAGGDVRMLIPFALGAVVFAPISEELFYRAGVFAILRQHFPRGLAYLLCGIVFGAVHADMAAFLPLTALGAWFAFLYDNTADLRVPIATHAFFNLATVVWALLAPGAI